MGLKGSTEKYRNHRLESIVKLIAAREFKLFPKEEREVFQKAAVDVNGTKAGCKRVRSGRCLWSALPY